MTHRYPVEVLHLVVSPGHNYAGRPTDGAGPHPTHDLDEATLVTGKGISGDRFHDRPAHRDAAVTVFAIEALEAVAAELGLPAVPDPVLLRRNVVLRGVELDPLRGNEFAIESADGAERVVLSGGRIAQPCAWMDAVLAPGAHAALRGRGGLRCGVVHGGAVRRGPAVLVSPVVLDPSRAGLPPRRRTP